MKSFRLTTTNPPTAAKPISPQFRSSATFKKHSTKNPGIRVMLLR
jgi:hypothetical protein